MTAATRYEIPGGDAGAVATLARMRALVDRSLGNPVVRDALQTITRLDPPRDDTAHALSIRRFLADRVKFLADPLGVELLHDPEWMIREIARRGYLGLDCDDVAVLGAALCKNAGIRCLFRVVAFWSDKNPYQHVYTLAETGTGLVELDTTKPNVATPPIGRMYTEEV